ncbi:MAG: translocation/assembly module TamB [Spartobacteria bacterium]|nr:translocation/assembly module TamB [Spartobacteria bacterium]
MKKSTCIFIEILAWTGRIIRWILTGSLVLFFSAFMVLRFPVVQNKICQVVNESMAETGSPVVMKGLHGSPPFHFSLDTLDVMDVGGTNWLTMNALRVDWSIRALFRYRIQLDVVHADSIVMKTIPDYGPSEEKEKTPLEIPSLSIPKWMPELYIKNLNIDSVELSEAVADKKRAFALSLSAQTVSTTHLKADVGLHMLQKGLDDIQLHAAWQESNLLLRARFNETDGLIAEAVPQIAMQSLMLEGDMKGNMTDWMASINASTTLHEVPVQCRSAFKGSLKHVQLDDLVIQSSSNAQVTGTAFFDWTEMTANAALNLQCLALEHFSHLTPYTFKGCITGTVTGVYSTNAAVWAETALNMSGVNTPWGDVDHLHVQGSLTNTLEQDFDAVALVSCDKVETPWGSLASGYVSASVSNVLSHAPAGVVTGGFSGISTPWGSVSNANALVVVTNGLSDMPCGQLTLNVKEADTRWGSIASAAVQAQAQDFIQTIPPPAVLDMQTERVQSPWCNASGMVAHARIAYDEDKQDHVALDLHALSLDSQWGTLATAEVHAAASGFLQGLHPGNQVQVQVAADQYVWNTVDITNTVVHVDGPLSNLLWSVDSAGAYDESLHLTVTGGVQWLSMSNIACRLDTLSTHWSIIDMKMEKPAHFLWKDDTITIDALQLSGLGGTFNLNGSAGPDKLAAVLDVKQLDLALLQHWGSPLEDGRVSMLLAVDGTLASPEISLKTDVDAVDLSDLAHMPLPPWNFSAMVGYSNQYLVAGFDSTGVTNCTINGHVSLPVDVTLEPFTIETRQDQPMDVGLKAMLDLAIISPVMESAQQDVGGNLVLSAQMKGIVSNVNTEARLQLENGIYENWNMGTVLREITLDAALNPDGLYLKHLSARDVDQGLIQGGGQILMQPEKNFPFEWTLSVTNTQVMNQELASVTCDGGLRFFGDVKESVISGSVHVAQAKINFPKEMPPEVTILDVTVTNALGHNALNLLDENSLSNEVASAPFPVQLQLQIQADRNIFVNGRGLNSEWSTDLSVRGGLDRPIVIGQLAAIRGTFLFLGNQLTLDECNITFEGGWPIMPQLGITAYSNAGDIRAIVRLTGPADQPQITLLSQPMRQQDEILSMLLFGKKPNELSSGQALQIAYAINVLQGGFNAFSIVDQVGTKLALDQISVNPGIDGNPSIVVGKYIGQRIYVQGEASLSETVGDAIQADIKLTPSTKLQLRVSDLATEGNSVYLDWFRNY